MLHGVAFSGAALLISLQVFVALLWHHEEMIPRPKCSCPRDLVRAKEQWLAIMASALLIVCLWQQQTSVAYDEDGRCEFHGDQTPLANERLMLSWSVLVIVIFCIAMFAGIMPGVQWWMRADYAKAEASETTRTGAPRSKMARSEAARSKAARSRVRQARDWCGSCINKASDLELAYDELFSYERGRYYLLKGVVVEIVEVVTQTSQLHSFSHERPKEWIVGLSVILLLNGLLLPVPFVSMRSAPGWNKAAKLIFTGIDAAFDSGCLLITILHSQRSEFSEKTWWIATLGVIVPIAGIALTARDISEAARNMVLSNEWRRSKGTARQRRQSTMVAVAEERADQTFGHRIALVFSVLISIFCIVTGGIFLGKAIDGDRACRGLLGDTLWDGSSPKFVVVKDGGSLRGGCNFEGIREIFVSDDGTAPMVKLPPVLLRLPQLESLVLLGHDIASDGVPVAMFEGVALPNLNHLQFGTNDPVNRTLDLSARRGRSLDAFPYHALQLMGGLESLQLGGQNISCFPDLRLLPGLRELRKLNLSGTRIRYLPPSVLFEHSLLEVDLSGTPVSESLDWSHHGLGSEFVWSRMTTTLPLLTSLDLSWNSLEDANVSNINLNDLQRLRRLDSQSQPRFDA